MIIYGTDLPFWTDSLYTHTIGHKDLFYNSLKMKKKKISLTLKE
jgi:hypothetical protein